MRPLLCLYDALPDRSPEEQENWIPFRIWRKMKSEEVILIEDDEDEDPVLDMDEDPSEMECNALLMMKDEPSHGIPSQGTTTDSSSPKCTCHKSRRWGQIIENPDWLPKGWITEMKIRKSGSSAGNKDKYYFEPGTKMKFRSKAEVLRYLRSGVRGSPTPQRPVSNAKAKASPGCCCYKPTHYYPPILCESPVYAEHPGVYPLVYLPVIGDPEKQSKEPPNEFLQNLQLKPISEMPPPHNVPTPPSCENDLYRQALGHINHQSSTNSQGSPANETLGHRNHQNSTNSQSSPVNQALGSINHQKSTNSEASQANQVSSENFSGQQQTMQDSNPYNSYGGDYSSVTVAPPMLGTPVSDCPVPASAPGPCPSSRTVPTPPNCENDLYRQALGHFNHQNSTNSEGSPSNQALGSINHQKSTNSEGSQADHVSSENMSGQQQTMQDSNPYNSYGGDYSSVTVAPPLRMLGTPVSDCPVPASGPGPSASSVAVPMEAQN